jgi:hypothetical protein
MKAIICLLVYGFLTIAASAQKRINIDSINAEIQLLRKQVKGLKTNIDSLVAISPTRAKHTIFVEAMGAGGYGSVNYENRFHKNTTVRIGLGYMNWYVYGGGLGAYSYILQNGGGTETSFNGSLTLPCLINYCTDEYGSPGHFEVGIGLTPWFGENTSVRFYSVRDSQGKPHYVNHEVVGRTSGLSFYVPMNIGYRYQPAEGGFFFRIAAHALVGEKIGFLPWIGLSLGHTFE